LSGLRKFLEDYRSECPNDVFQILDPVTVDYETTAYYKLMETRDPVLWFDKISNFPDFTIASNILGNKRRMAWANDCDQSDLFRKWREIISHSGPIEIDDHKAEVKQVINSAEQVNLFELPICKHFLQDGSELGFPRYVTSGLAVARDPSSPDIINLSYARMQLISKNEYAFDLGSKGHFERYVEFSKRRGKTLPVSIIIGAHPLYYMLAAAFIENEYSKATKLLDARYTNGITNDIPIPLDAEIVLEAEVDPIRFVKEGPFSEFTGYISKDTTGNVGHVKAILRKKNAIYYDIIPSNSNEHVNLFSMPRDCVTTQIFEEVMPKTSNYRLEWPPAGAHILALCEVTSRELGLAKQAGLAVLALDPLFSKIVLVTEGKTDLDLFTFLMNLALDQKEGRRNNVSIIGDLFCIRLDPTPSQRGFTSKAIMVARGRSLPFSKTVEGDEVHLESNSAKVIVSHTASSNCEVSLVVGDDIDLTNERDLIWAISTRMRPDEDILCRDGRLIINANKKFAEVPELPSRLLSELRVKLAKKV
jgi:UbiD family decarboxylase